MFPGLFLAAYASSGLAGLVYEVSWTRLLGLTMGHSTAASSAVLASFMGGLALGAAAGGRLAPRLTRRRALFVYAALELLVIVLALALPFELKALEPLFTRVYHDGAGGWWFPTCRLLSCLALLIGPSTALGATFPVAVRWFVDGASRPGRMAGRLYAANTIGAAVGALASGFVLVPALGVWGTMLVGAAASLAAVAAVLTVAAWTADVAAAPEAAAAPPLATTRRVAGSGRRRLAVRAVQRIDESPRPWLAGAVVMVTGFATFSLEIAWTRVFSLIVGPSTYAFAATVTAFIGGLAVGSTLGAGLSNRVRHPARTLGIVLGCTALASAWAGSLAGGALPRRMLADFASAPHGSLLMTHALLVAAVIFPTAIGLGAAFPLALDLTGAGSQPARRLGAIYAANTVAAVAGSVATGVVTIPWLGLEYTMVAATLMLIAGSALALGGAGGTVRSWLGGLLPAGAGALLLFAGPAWDRALLASGAYKYAASVAPGLDLETALKAGALIFYRDGSTGTVSVKRLTGELSLSIDGKVDASSSGDMLTQKTLAHLPLLLHEDPEVVCIIGLGSGGTLASALTHPVKAVDVLEISPEVVAASRLFAGSAGSPLDDPRTRLIVADGRTHLALSSRTYDVIISEPSNPWMAGVAALFTREFFAAARDRLSLHGIICQWVNTYDISTDDLRSVVATFSSVFPNGTLWLVGDGDLLLVGSAEPLDGRIGHIAQAWRRPGVAADLQAIAVREPFSVLSMFLGGPSALSQFGQGAIIQTDNRLALEFSAPRALRTVEQRTNVSLLRSLADSTEPPAAVTRAWREADGESLANRAEMLRLAGAFNAAYEAYDAGLTAAPGAGDGLLGLVESAVGAGRQADALAFLKARAAATPGDAATLVALSRLHAATGGFTEAVQMARDAAALPSRDPAALEQLASIYADLGEADQLSPVVDALARDATRPSAHYFAASVHFLRGELEPALAEVRRTLTLDSRHARAHNLAGAIHANLGHNVEARAAFEAALAINPRDPTTYQNLALLELNSGNRSTAARLFAEALSLDPTAAAAREGLRTATEPND
jgi:spermidine synthase